MNILAIIVIGCLTQFASIGVITTAISKLELIDGVGIYSSSVSIANTLGISFTGIVLGGFLRKYQGFRVGFYGPIISAFLIPILIFTDNIYVILTAIFLLSIIIGLDNPNNNSSLNNLIRSDKDKAHFFTKYTTAIQTSLIVSPLLSAAIIVHFGHDFSFLFFLIFYLVTCIPWMISSALRQMKTENGINSTDIWLGYKIILNSAPLKGLTINRILNNLIFTGVIVLIPVMVAKASTSNVQFTVIQNFIFTFISAGFVTNGLISNRVLKNNPSMVSVFSKASTIFAVVSILIAAAFDFNKYSLYVMAAILGWGQFYFRITGMTLGQAITPQEHLGEVILASDTIVRGITAVYSLALLFLVNKYSSFIPLLVFVFIGSIAPIFLTKCSNIYMNKIIKEDE
ncbi:MFS transporter [Xenorhabdus sp. DI]|uniref:MFS transporter n=1 Tax=Xenorhabdus doucetiae TaxID=351671 RepID=UPI0019BFBEB0|nr:MULTISPECIES: MFS transporter [unclassified Xenorhabdus]MBD2785101.1 MFS transporter [Xenorhabdus sp. 3]MBD2787564.1 MFS transporter [Xenorhabdus sp. DI]